MEGHSIYQPGMIVRLRDEPDWGLGQVQSAISGKVTVNFSEMGKQVLDETRVHLEIVSIP